MIRIVSSYFVVGIILDADLVIEAPPIVRYMKGWYISRVYSYCKMKGWDYECVLI